MKRIKLGILCLSTLVLTCACSKNSGTMTCTNTVENGNYKSVVESKINYEDGYVTTMTTKEETTAPSDEAAEDFKILLDNVYIKYNRLDGFTSNIEAKNKTVTAITTIDYNTIDLKKLGEIDESNKAMLVDGKVSIDKIKANFKNQGATCR